MAIVWCGETVIWIEVVKDLLWWLLWNWVAIALRVVTAVSSWILYLG